MAGTKYGSFAVGDANIDNVMLQLAGVETGYCALTLTEMTTTNVPQIAAGSKIEVGGSLFKFDANETITGSATTGTNYIRLVPSGSSITAAWTTTEPTWSDSKQGWYDGTGANRYIPYHVVYATTPTYNKYAWLSVRGRNNGGMYDGASGGITATALRSTAAAALAGIVTITGCSSFKDNASAFFMGDDDAGVSQYRKSTYYTTPGTGAQTFTHGISSLLTAKRLRHITVLVGSTLIPASGWTISALSDTTITFSGLTVSTQYLINIDYSA